MELFEDGKDERPEVLELWRALQASRSELEKLLEDVCGHWRYEDGMYRLYHQSFKVWNLQPITEQIVAALKALRPPFPLNGMFLKIVEDGTSNKFEFSFNKNWLLHARPVVEAFLHAKYFLEMAVKYGKELESPPAMLPSGWAAFLYLYNLR